MTKTIIKAMFLSIMFTLTVTGIFFHCTEHGLDYYASGKHLPPNPVAGFLAVPAGRRFGRSGLRGMPRTTATSPTHFCVGGLPAAINTKAVLVAEAVRIILPTFIKTPATPTTQTAEPTAI